MCGIEEHRERHRNGEQVEQVNPVQGDDERRRLVTKDVDRRQFLKLTGATAGAGAMLGGAGTTAASSVEDPYTERYVSADSSNYTTDWRGASDINWIVVHVTDGSYSGAISWFQNGGSNVSAHYVISNYETTAYDPGHTTQMVQHKDRAWHASASNSPSIGIEHEWYADYGRFITDECYRRSGQLIDWLCDEYNIPKVYYEDPTCIFNEPGGIIGHTDAPSAGDCSAYPTKACPYPDGGIDPDTLMSYVDGGSTGSCGSGTDYKFAMDDDIVVSGTSSGLNGREGPGLHYDVVGTYQNGEEGYIMNGPEWSDGYTWWGVHFPRPNDWVWCVEDWLACNN